MRRLLLGFAALLLAAACSPRGDRIVVCSGASAEQRILGEVIVQQLARRTTVPVERDLGREGPLACHRAQGSGKVDVYPENATTALADILRHRAVGEPEAAVNLIAREFSERFHVVWLPSFGPEGRTAPVVRDAAVRRHPEIRSALGELAGAMPDSTVRRLVGLVDAQHRSVADVAREFLAGLPR